MGKSSVVGCMASKLVCGKNDGFFENVKKTVSEFENLSTCKSSESYFTFIDSPGNSQFIKSVIARTFMADTALLVLDSTTRSPSKDPLDHSWLAFSLGIKQIICYLNKMDATSPTYSKERSDLLKRDVSSHLDQVGYIPRISYSSLYRLQMVIMWVRGQR
ncbi:hypothetical protein M8C21_003470 [Ambrosia artemisiifolia]|uniref:Tr-type G domain-containing protein n=1 Tax=Ambrosia artemisiifolia TaxID=4212 RepID=A0AAD5CVF2_AMBAR|nr:hypothetical protein M8C21_003470 [Ambrosia artemisiifolia]